MLFPHVVDFQSTEAANGQGFFQCQTGMVCMDMDLDDLIIADTNNGIPNGTQIGFQLLHSGVIGIFHIDEKFCAVSKSNAFIIHGSQCRIFFLRSAG